MANSNGWGDGSVNNNIGWGQAPNNNISWGKSQITSWSGATDIDGGNAPVNTVAPVISGNTSLGSVLTTTNGTWTSLTTLTYTYQWYRGATLITSATNQTYTLVVADSAASITCKVTATNILGSNVATSNAITAQTFSSPVNTVAPAITGTAQEGQTLTCSTGTWTGNPTPTYSYQWKRNGSNIGSATNSTYVLVTADVGQSIKCTVTATNFIGSSNADSNTVTPTSSVDADAQAFITAASITNPTQQAAINTLVVDLKGYNIWSKMKAIYPFCGSTASQHKWNLRDPRDLDAAFRLVFSGGWTHSSTGALPNGTNAFADTKLIPNTNLSLNSTHISGYLRTNLNSDAPILSSENSGTYNNGLYIWPKQVMFGYSIRINDNTSQPGGTNTDDIRGFHVALRTASNIKKYILNNIEKFNVTTASTALNTSSIYIGASRNNANYFNNQIAFASIGDGLTDTEAANFYTAVQAFQTTLGRSIGTQTVSDADAQAFVTNAGIVDQVEANAINNLVIGMKADGLWSKMKAVYPFVGGTSTSNSYNLKNTAQYQITWNGGVTHSSNGITGNGSNGYGDTFLNNNVMAQNDAHVSIYSRTNFLGTVCDIGSWSGAFGSMIYSRNSAGSFESMINGGTRVIEANTNSTGFYLVTRKSASSITGQKNTTQYVTASTSTNYITTSFKLLRAGEYNGEYSPRNLAFASIGDGLTDTDATNLNSRVTTFQTTLNRL